MRLIPSKYNYHHKIDHDYSLLNNTLTGAFDLIENDKLARFLKSSRPDLDIKDNSVKELLDRGYLYVDTRQEKRLLDTVYSNYLKKANKRPLRFVFCPTFACNLRCNYCFEKRLPNIYMSDDMLLKAFESVKLISKTYKGKLEGIELFGGEPLLPKTKPLVKKIIDFALSMEAEITIISNGVFAKEFIEVLKPADDYIDMIQITMDGPKEINDKRRIKRNGKGSFDDICKSIDSLLASGMYVNLRVNIDDLNLESLPALYEHAMDKGWLDDRGFSMKPFMVTDHSSAGYAFPILSPDKLLKRIIRLYDEYPEIEKICGFYMFKPLRHILDILRGAPNVAPRFFNCESNLLELMIFCPDGYIYACPESIGSKCLAIGKYYPELCFFTEKEKIWTDRDILKIDGCKDCTFAPLCGGGCAYSSIILYGDNKRAVCEPFREVLDIFLENRGRLLFSDHLGIKEKKPG